MSRQRGTNAQRAYAAAQPSKTDKTVSTKPVAAVANSLSDEGIRDQAVHMILLRIHWMEAERKIQEALMLTTVDEAREVGATWQEIGDAYGVTAQAAWQKYRVRSNPNAFGGKPGQTEELPFD